MTNPQQYTILCTFCICLLEITSLLDTEKKKNAPKKIHLFQQPEQPKSTPEQVQFLLCTHNPSFAHHPCPSVCGQAPVQRSGVDLYNALYSGVANSLIQPKTSTQVETHQHRPSPDRGL